MGKRSEGSKAVTDGALSWWMNGGMDVLSWFFFSRILDFAVVMIVIGRSLKEIFFFWSLLYFFLSLLRCLEGQKIREALY